MSKLVFFPWPAITASETAKMQSWTATGDFEVDHYTGNPVNAVRSRVFGEIYIFGHCSAGSNTLSNDDNVHLTYQEVADTLETSGLKKIFSGAIKIFACESGAPVGVTMSFAKKFAKHMFSDKKYMLARVYGYTKPLNSQMDSTQQVKAWGEVHVQSVHKKPHKWASSEYWAGHDWVEATKAKDAREYFSPF